jgi:hypothetical protein
MVQNVYISPKHLGIVEERHLFYMLENFFENKAFEGENFRFEVLVTTDDDRKPFAFIMYYVLCIPRNVY